MAMIPVRFILGFLLVLAVAFATACGGDDSPAPAPAATPSEPAQPAAEPAKPPPPSIPNNKITVDERDEEGNPVRFSGVDEKGNQFEARFGDDANVPDGFPEDVPIYPGSTPTAVMTAGSEGMVVTLKSSDDQGTIFSFYESGLSEQGWSIDGKPSFGGQMGLEASKDSRKATLRISGTEGDSYISIVVSEGS